MDHAIAQDLRTQTLCKQKWGLSMRALCGHQSPTLGAHTHAHSCPWVLGGHGCDIIVHGWAWVQYYW